MSSLLRSLLVLGVASLLMVGCGEKEVATPVEEAPVATPVETAPVEAAPVAGGYEPTAEERVPGITIDPATLAAQAEAAAAPVEVEAAAE
ncbi:MAG: hypothetical protein Q8S46_08985 [Methylotenera sp.]|nr:hypothetical protein [Methylotenera sp.]MDO9232053.1 hypothetical protein [Methylotenera sp.]MDO9387991.1 hypothetical protein [Methylotenera sp.]MDP1596586.1 hypothetical protein [Methylotenera sp.]MDP1754367.1 hypothetical protein [Methylotenera sp.]